MLSLKISKSFYQFLFRKWCINDSYVISSALGDVKYCSNCCNPCGPCDSGSGSGKSSEKSHRIAYKPYVPPCHEDHDHKNMRLKRPMSPHVTMYAPTLPAMTSIATRITGAILTTYSIILAGGALFLSNGVDTYVSMIQSLHLSGSSTLFIKLLIGLPFAYHYAFGIRFTCWNTGRFLLKNQVYGTAYQALLLAGVITVFFAFFL